MLSVALDPKGIFMVKIIILLLLIIMNAIENVNWYPAVTLYVHVYIMSF